MKALPSGEPYPPQSGIEPLFRVNDIKTLNDVLMFCAKRYGRKACLATRRILKRERVTKDGLMLEKLVLGKYTARSYIGVAKIARNIGFNIRLRGVRPFDRVLIFAETRAQWLMVLFGCL